VPRILDHNSGAVLGFAELAANNYEGKRYWSSNCYKFGNNVTTWVHTLAAKILFDGKRATSVQLIRKAGAGMSARVTVTARKEIILSSGVQGSAKLLLLR
jgi:choline dehydrogenase-like flavoprotein